MFDPFGLDLFVSTIEEMSKQKPLGPPTAAGAAVDAGEATAHTPDPPASATAAEAKQVKEAKPATAKRWSVEIPKWGPPYIVEATTAEEAWEAYKKLAGIRKTTQKPVIQPVK